ncbi:MAG: class I SAM-dependent methyltransferase, partial [Bdellovibrio sp.]|nr:class I SAM-dependent methyltransferase [Bdellovibrio sp.]
MNTVREQYERFPYPPLSRFALPRKNQGKTLSYEYGFELLTLNKSTDHFTHAGKRILVAGAGTFEPLLVAITHPLASEIIAIDFSQPSLDLLAKRIEFYKLTNLLLRPYKKTDLPQIKLLHQNIEALKEPFDYIIASNVLHHSANPSRLLNKLSSLLKPQGILRVVTYPKQSRIWMRMTSQWLKLNNITPSTPRLKQKAYQCISLLPPTHPIVSCFLSQPETNTETGIVDSFLNACENPLSPLELEQAAREAGLVLFAESQADTSKSEFLEKLCQKTKNLTKWEKLQILDDLLELCTNPVLWFIKQENKTNANTETLDFNKTTSHKNVLILSNEISPQTVFEQLQIKSKLEILLPSHVYYELSKGLKRAQLLLEKSNIEIKEMIQLLKEQVGQRVKGSFFGKPIPNLTIWEYDLEKILGTPKPWNKANWDNLELLLQDKLVVFHKNDQVYETTLWESIQKLQLYFVYNENF